jgi:hypothetical protein
MGRVTCHLRSVVAQNNLAYDRQPGTFEAEHSAAGPLCAKLPDGRQYGQNDARTLQGEPRYPQFYWSIH